MHHQRIRSKTEVLYNTVDVRRFAEALPTAPSSVRSLVQYTMLSSASVNPLRSRPP
jgi:hypothetical protein